MLAPVGSGVINLTSPHAFEDTLRRLEQALGEAGMTIFARIDQKAAAQTAGMTMRPMVLVLFGNPRAGTPLMQAYPTLAIDLPLKALVWEDADGQVLVSTNSPEYLQQRHATKETPFVHVPGLLQKALKSHDS